MYYLIYLTERCNLQCTYCETPTTPGRLTQDAAWEVDDLCRFLAEDDDLSLWLFGGEPLLRIDLIEALLGRLDPRRVIIQTNGLYLDHLPQHLLPRFFAVVISIDGPREITDRYRGAGCIYWTVTTDGNVFPCPALRSHPRYSMGSFRDLSPAALRSSATFGEPCISCRLWNVCGGRCLYAHVEKQWDEQGYRLVCGTVTHLIDELRRVQPVAERAIARGEVAINDFISCPEHEVIP